VICVFGLRFPEPVMLSGVEVSAGRATFVFVLQMHPELLPRHPERRQQLVTLSGDEG